MICTAAVERTVHKHLEDQIRYLDDKDAELRQLIMDIQKEENQHLEHAEAHAKRSILTQLMFYLITASTEAVIWLSTQGDVSRMRRIVADN